MIDRNEVILVDMYDREKGSMEKLQAHREGLLHRAFSVFLYRGDEILLQRRAKAKYHCGGLWTNTCCSHPGLGEDTEESARKRLFEEMGIHAGPLQEIHSFVYRAPFPNGLTEYEYDHVYVGEFDGEVPFDPREVEEISWVKLADLMSDVVAHPENYTPWFLIALKPVEEYLTGPAAKSGHHPGKDAD